MPEMTQLCKVIGVQRKAQPLSIPAHGQGLKRGDARRGQAQTVISGVTPHQMHSVAAQEVKFIEGEKLSVQSVCGRFAGGQLLFLDLLGLYEPARWIKPHTVA
jgi:hypothetical protein